MQKIIRINLELECGVSKAFKMFTENEKLESWLTEKAEVESKVGGKYELFWDPENREINSTIGCKITSYEINKFVSFEWKGPEQFQSFMNFDDPLTHVVVLFFPIRTDNNKTFLSLLHSGWRDSPDWQEARLYFDKVWMGALNHLKEKVSKKEI